MSLNRLMTVAASAAFLCSVGACGSDTGTGGSQAGVPASIVLSTAPASTGAAGTSVGTLTVKVVDASGAGVSSVSVSFSVTGGATVSPSTALTDASGTASTQVSAGTTAGTSTIRAAVNSLTTAVSTQVTTTAGPTVRIVVAPKTLRFLNVGDTARVVAAAQDQYGNPAGAGAVTYSVVDASLVTVDATGLVRVLKLNGTTLVISSSGGKADTTVVNVLPPGSTNCTGLVGPSTLAVGDAQVFSGAQYGCLSGTATGAEFVITTFNSSTDQTNSLAVSVTANGVAAVPSTFRSPASSGLTALRAAIGGPIDAAPKLDMRFHTQLLAQANAQFHGRMGRVRAMSRSAVSRSISPTGANVGRSQSGIPATAQVGDILTLNVSGAECSSPTNHALRVKAVGTYSIVLADTLNPANGFSDPDFLRISANFDTLVYPLDVSAFGAPSDIDKNGRVGIIFTRAVNELTPANSNFYVGGFFNPRDLFPKVTVPVTDNCPGSNEGEMFYMLAPDPTGVVNGNKHTTGFVDSITVGILAHEFQHLINGSRRFYVNTAAQDFEEVWLNEGLSHMAEELLYYRQSGLAPRMNLTDSLIRIINRPTYVYWKNDASANFSRFLEYLRAPGANSPYANDDQLATRGATWSFLRYMADRLGPSDGNMWQKFDDATVTGLATLTSVYGTDPGPFFRDWAVANYMDDFAGNKNPVWQHQSWNFRDIYVNTFLNISSYPLVVTGLADNGRVDLSVRGGSANYLRLAVGAGKEGLLTFSSGGGAPFGSFQFVVVRTK